MRQSFEIFGHFYEISGYKCRRYLDIKKLHSDVDQPDIMVVMMNPGSSYPMDGIDNNGNPSPAFPDRTQDQIMKVMENAGYFFARVLNLSDLRHPNSNEFYKFIESKDAQKVAHSIFFDERSREFYNLFRAEVPVIYAWGVSKKLESLAKIAIERISSKNHIGVKKLGNNWAYYHPLPRTHPKQQKWVESVSLLLKNA